MLGFAAGVPAGFGAGWFGNGLMTGADVGLTAGVTPDGWLGLDAGAGATGADVPAGRVLTMAGAVVPGFAAGAENAGVGVPTRAGTPVAPLLDVPGLAAGAAPRLGGVGVGGSGGATSRGGAAWDGADGRCCAGWSGTVGRSWAGIGVG